MLFALSGLNFGEMGEQFMKKKTVKYSNETIGKIKIIKDFLPKPEDLVLIFLKCKLKNTIFNIKK